MKRIAVFMVIICAIIVSCTTMQLSSPENNSPSVNTQARVSINVIPKDVACAKMEVAEERDVCYTNLMKTDTEAYYCDNLADFSLKITCYQNAAAKQKNPSLCVTLHEDYVRDQCYKGVAEAKQDPVICASIVWENLRKDCYKNIKLNLSQEREICSQLWTADLRAECHDIFQARK